MKNTINYSFRLFKRYLFIWGFLVLLNSCSEKSKKDNKETTKEQVTKVKEIAWQIKAIQSNGEKLAIKAIDGTGKLYDIHAIQDSDQDSFLDIKAFIGEKELPVKVLVSKKKYAPVKAIDRGGITYDIKAITSNGEKLDVKGIKREGNIVLLKAIDKEGNFIGIKAISPNGKLDDVKGIKINIKDTEMSLNGFKIHAHVKAMHESVNEDGYEVSKSTKKPKKTKKKEDFKHIFWKVNAIATDGKKLAIKAVDSTGNQFDVKAVQDSKQYSLMNIKAYVNGNELPIKVLVNGDDDKYSPVKALARDGNIYKIKAISEDGKLIDVKGISRSGNIINLNAVTENGEFYKLKAEAPDGHINEVKGIKIFKREKEMTISGNKVYAHVKAITQ